MHAYYNDHLAEISKRNSLHKVIFRANYYDALVCAGRSKALGEHPCLHLTGGRVGAELKLRRCNRVCVLSSQQLPCVVGQTLASGVLLHVSGTEREAANVNGRHNLAPASIDDSIAFRTAEREHKVILKLNSLKSYIDILIKTLPLALKFS